MADRDGQRIEVAGDQLTIAKLLIVTTAVCVALAATRLERNQATDYRTYYYFWQIVSGLNLAGLPLLLIRLRTTPRRHIAPGEWFWFSGGCMALIVLVWQSVFRDTAVSPSQLVALAAIQCTIAVLYLVPIIFCSGLWWRFAAGTQLIHVVYFAVLLFLMARGEIPLDEFMENRVHVGGYAVPLIALAGAIAVDWRNGTRRGWSHWCGLLLFAVGNAVGIWMALFRI